MTTAIKLPHPDDVAAGANLRRIRNLRRMSQEELGARLGITFQQVQKYEKGTNRLSISRALACCRALGCTIADLLAGIDEDGGQALQLPSISSQATRVAECFDRIEDERQRRHLSRLVEAMHTPPEHEEIDFAKLFPVQKEAAE
ncbi:MAG: helix-turn-helix domain-containing protein [Allorhizobium sp.]